MSSAVLFIGWNRAHVGLEAKAYAYLMGEGMAYLRSLRGTYVDSLEMVGLTAHRSDLNGFILLFGARIKLDELRRTDEFEAFTMALSMHFDRLGVVPGVTWEGIQAVMERRKALPSGKPE